MDITINIPEELGARMKSLGDDGNWSRIAAKAFEFEIAKMSELAAISDDTIRRLRETAIADEQEMHDAGRKAGRRWASQYARMMQLERLEKAEEDEDGVDWVDVGPDGFAQRVLREDAARWHCLSGEIEEPDSVAVQNGWLHAFSEGALEILEATRKG